MPKRPNAKKMASQAWSKVKTLDAAVSSGSYIIGHVKKNLGFCQFLCDVQISPGKTSEITALIRGKMKGGKTCPTRVEIGHYLLLEGDPKKTMEVVGVVNTRPEFETLKRAGRISDALLEKDAEDDDDLFDRSEEKAAVEDIWAKRDEEREAEAAHLVNRYRRAEAGVRYRLSRLGAEKETDAVEPVAEEGFALWADAEPEVVAEPAEVKPEKGSGPAHREITSKRRLAAMAAEEAAARAAEEAEARAFWMEATSALAAVEAAEAAAEEALKALASRKVADCWEDEIDIDAI
jgi:hypothetical protein